MHRYFGLLAKFLIICQITICQIPNGSWRDHLPYHDVKKIVEVGNKMFCLASNNLFSYNKSDNSIIKYNKINGLKDVGISTIDYSEAYNCMIIGYSNGNIDFMTSDSIINIPFIKDKTILGDKIIKNIFFSSNLAYLSTGFGIVVFDLLKREIKDTYQFGEAGSAIYVNDIAIIDNYIYAATKEGIFKADLSSPNLVDFNYWEKLDFVPDAEYNTIEFFSNTIFAVYYDVSSEQDEIIVVSSDNYNLWNYDEDTHYSSLVIKNNKLIVCSNISIKVYDESFNLELSFSEYTYNGYAVLDEKNILWIGTYNIGLVKYENNQLSNYCPNGPSNNSVSDIEYESGIIWTAAGSKNNYYNARGAYSFVDNSWKTYSVLEYPIMEGFGNIHQIAIDPSNTKHIYGGSFGFGVIEFLDNNVVDIFDETDGILQPIQGYGHGFVWISGMDYDRQNNLWLVASSTNDPLYVIRKDGTWENVKLNYSGFSSETTINDLLVTSWGHIWLLLGNKGIVVFYEDGNTIHEKFFSVKTDNGKILDAIYSIAEDKEGNIWIGTRKGPVVYYSAQNIFNVDDEIGYQIKIPRNDGTNNADLLLENQTINAISVDGGDRKWFATANSGVFLMSKDAIKEIHHFNAENSPLLSNYVECMAINHCNGEVFFGTENGLISFMSTATEGNSDFSNVYVYPNPVRPDYEGEISITGLVENVIVKITDISGNLVYETNASGGKAVWNGVKFNGKKAGSGVYLVFSSNLDGTKTNVTKFLIIN